jgi:uncharacterized protein (TIGR00730 family)
MMRRICVFCGSSAGADPAFAAAAARLGTLLAEAGIGLVYGGGRAGLMGIVADAALAAGGEVIGVIPQALVDRELAHRGCTQLHVTPSMHARKAMMADLADGFVALPGGIGTLEELFEVWTWAQLGDHRRPVALLNVAGFYDTLITFIDEIEAKGFLRHRHGDMLLVADDAPALLETMRGYSPPETTPWILPAER